METRPKIGAMMRCVAPRYEAGGVTYNGQTRIHLPHRSEEGKIIPRMFDLYEIKQVGRQWIYQRVEVS